MQTVVYISANEGKLQQVIEYANGVIVELPIEKDGTIKWFDDSALIKKY